MEMAAEPSVRVFGVLCTYRRPALAISFIDALRRQTLSIATLVVVDNGNDESLASSLRQLDASPISVIYIAPGSNLGPAGALHEGLVELAGLIAPDDLIIHFDDDDPPVDSTQIAHLVHRLLSERRRDPTIGGIGLSGGNLNRRTGVVSAASRSSGLAEVDHLHGGYLPTYVARALQEVDGNDPSFFFGFEELELGRRLGLEGWHLLVDVAFMEQLQHLYSKKSEAPTVVRNPDHPWSRFHKERNLIRILRRERLWCAVAFTVFVRHLVAPLVRGVIHPAAAFGRVRLGLRAAAAGLRNEGGIDSRYPPPR